MKLIIACICIISLLAFVQGDVTGFASPPSASNFMLDSPNYHVQFEDTSMHIFARKLDNTLVQKVSLMLGVSGIAEFRLNNPVNCPRNWDDATPTQCNIEYTKTWMVTDANCNIDKVPTSTQYDTTKNATRSRSKIILSWTDGPSVEFIVDVFDRAISGTFAGFPLDIPEGALEVSVPVTKWDYQPNTSHIAIGIRNRFLFSEGQPMYSIVPEKGLAPDGNRYTLFVNNNFTFPDQLSYLLRFADFALVDGEFAPATNHTQWNLTIGFDQTTLQTVQTMSQWVLFPKFNDTFMYDPTLSIVLLGENVVDAPSAKKSSRNIATIAAPVAVCSVVLITAVIAIVYWKKVIAKDKSPKKFVQPKETQAAIPQRPL